MDILTLWMWIGMGLTLIIWLFLYLKYYPSYVQSKQDTSTVSLFGGLLEIVFWGHYEGILLTRNRRLLYVSEGDEGGEKVIFPLLGDRVAARFKLGTELLRWNDLEKTLTKDGLRVQICIAIRWKISSISDYYFKINRDHLEGKKRKRGLSNKDLKMMADRWLKMEIEGTLRRLVRELNVSELISFTSSAMEVDVHKINHRKDFVAKDSLKSALKLEFISSLQTYGIEIENVEIQDIQFENEIQQAFNQLKKAAFAERENEYKGRAELAKLKPLLETMGKDAIVLIEAMKNMKGSMFMGNMPMLQGLMQEFSGNSNTSNLKSMKRSKEVVPLNGKTPRKELTTAEQRRQNLLNGAMRKQ